jgi:hypothetical protein
MSRKAPPPPKRNQDKKNDDDDDPEQALLASLGSSVQNMDQYEEGVLKTAEYDAVPKLTGNVGFPDLSGMVTAGAAPLSQVATVQTVLGRLRRGAEGGDSRAKPSHNLKFLLKQQMLLNLLHTTTKDPELCVRAKEEARHEEERRKRFRKQVQRRDQQATTTTRTTTNYNATTADIGNLIDPRPRSRGKQAAKMDKAAPKSVLKKRSRLEDDNDNDNDENPEAEEEESKSACDRLEDIKKGNKSVSFAVSSGGVVKKSNKRPRVGIQKRKKTNIDDKDGYGAGGKMDQKDFQKHKEHLLKLRKEREERRRRRTKQWSGTTSTSTTTTTTTISSRHNDEEEGEEETEFQEDTEGENPKQPDSGTTTAAGTNTPAPTTPQVEAQTDEQVAAATTTPGGNISEPTIKSEQPTDESAATTMKEEETPLVEAQTDEQAAAATTTTTTPEGNISEPTIKLEQPTDESAATTMKEEETPQVEAQTDEQAAAATTTPEGNTSEPTIKLEQPTDESAATTMKEEETPQVEAQADEQAAAATTTPEGNISEPTIKLEQPTDESAATTIKEEETNSGSVAPQSREEPANDGPSTAPKQITAHCPLCRQQIIQAASQEKVDEALSEHVHVCGNTKTRGERRSTRSRAAVNYAENNDPIEEKNAMEEDHPPEKAPKRATGSTKKQAPDEKVDDDEEEHAPVNDGDDEDDDDEELKVDAKDEPLDVEMNDDSSAPLMGSRVRVPTDDWDEDNYEDRVDDWIENGIQNMRLMKEQDANETPPGEEVYDGGLVIPAWINDRLFPYQRTALQWMWELHRQQAGGIIGDEMVSKNTALLYLLLRKALNQGSHLI